MNEQIENLFRGFTVAGESIPFAFLYYDGHGETYFTYQEYDKENSYSSDDNISGYVVIYDFDIYSKGNYNEVVQAIKDKLTIAGWTWQPLRDSADMFETDTGYYHKTISFAYPIQIN